MSTRLIVAMMVAALSGCVMPPSGPVSVPPPPTYPAPPTPDAVRPPDAPPPSPRPEPNASWCAGIRGNGTRFFSHFGSLARATEYYGFPSCIAGGSSGSISSFLVESIWAGGLVTDCDGTPCTPTQQRARGALLLKSVTALSEVGALADVFTVFEILGRLTTDFVGTITNPALSAAYTGALNRISQDLSNIVNPDFQAVLAQSPFAPVPFVDVIGALVTALSFKLENALVFIRPGLLNFDAIAALLGRVASFYAGYGSFYDAPAMRAWLDACAAPSVNLTWVQASALPGSGAANCGAEFRSIYLDYRNAFVTAPIYNRLDDPIGRYLPVLTTTAALTGDAIPAWYQARADYVAQRPVGFTPNFDDVRFGYWGQAGDLATVQAGLAGLYPSDPVTAKFLSLGAQPWREVMLSSPAEPGFAAAQRLASGPLAVGGWDDPLRVQVLRALGASKVVAINKQGGVGTFERNAATVLGASPAQVDALFTLEPPPVSSFATALADADGVWCSDWDRPDLFDFPGLFTDGYTGGRFITDDPYFTASPAPNVVAPASTAILGCTPGVTGPYPD